MANSASKMPWSDIGSEHAKGLVADCDKTSCFFRDALQGASGGSIPNFESSNWRYEFCIFNMFWFWYVANSPKFTREGGTKPLLDAFHRGCYEAFRQTKLIDDSEDALRRWEDDVYGRFLAYKRVWDAHLARIDDDTKGESLKMIHDSLGWHLLDYLFPSQQPDSRVVIFLNAFGSFTFTGLVEMFTDLEKHYARAKPRWKFWSK
jgi:hypothetical protein